ncbi:MAG: hypothetical protein ACTTIM_04930, partial [Campylobacter sp.]
MCYNRLNFSGFYEESLVRMLHNTDNYANYLIRQERITFNTLTKEYDLAKQNQIDYRELPAQTSQQILKIFFNFFFKSFK